MSGQFDLASAVAAIQAGRPLIIADADEVILRFVDGFDRFLRARGLYLDLTTYRLHGNVKRLADRAAVLDIEVTALLDEFREDLDTLEAADGACEALSSLSELADIVVLSNITEAQAPARRRNLLSLGLNYPLIVNRGSKGPAVKALAARTGAKTFFIDDIPQHLADAAKLVPEIFLIHLVAEPKLRELIALSFRAHCYAGDWPRVRQFIARQLGHRKYD